MARRMLGMLIALLTLATSVSAQEVAPWKVGLATMKITPAEPVRMAGYASRKTPSEGVALDLFAKALVLEDAEGHVGLLLTSDVIGYRASYADRACQEISKRTGLKREQILLNCSHTHTGPVIGLEEVKAYGLAEDEAAATVRYSQGLLEQLAKVAEQALKSRSPARLSWGAGVVHFPMNRREFTPKGVKLGVNARGLADRSVPVLRIDGADGKLRAIVVGTACHNTTLGPKNMQISADYAGYAQRYLEAKHPGATAMFVQNCGGDANPYPRGSEEISSVHGRELGAEVDRVLGEKLATVRGPLTIAFGHADLPLQQLSRRQLEDLAAERSIHARNAQKMLALADDQLPKSYPAPLAVWQFGQDLTLVALSGEVVVDYVTLLEDKLGPNRLWIMAYSNDVYGYVPSRRVLREGGYETRGTYRGNVGFFAPEVEDVLVESVRKLAVQAGRKLPAGNP